MDEPATAAINPSAVPIEDLGCGEALLATSVGQSAPCGPHGLVSPAWSHRTPGLFRIPTPRPVRCLVLTLPAPDCLCFI